MAASNPRRRRRAADAPPADVPTRARRQPTKPEGLARPDKSDIDRLDPRVVATRNLVFAATMQVIAEGGLAKATVEQIAVRSGVARSTIYRRWPSLSLLHCEAFSHSARRSKVVARGDTRRELLLYLLDYADRLADDAYCSVLIALIDGSWRDPELARTRERLFDERTSRVATILEAGIRAGNLPPGLDIRSAAEAILAPFLYRRIVDHRSISNAEILDLHRELILRLDIGDKTVTDDVA